jgi:menaquinone-dependent protoporphyrinogen oxidase
MPNKRVLILHSSYDGQTGRIAERIGEVLRARGHLANVRPASAIGSAIPDCDAIAIGGAIRYGHHSRDLERLVRAERAKIESRPNAFFSVCLSAGGPNARPATARRYLDEFARRTGWEPQAVASFAGALLYSRYGFYIRFMMRLIMRMTGGVTDASRDYEYTDWAAVERFAGEFAERTEGPAAP